MPTYIFEGEKMYEVEDNGSRKLVATFPDDKRSDLPKNGRVTGYQATQGVSQHGTKTYGGTGQYGQTYPSYQSYVVPKPWDGIDRKRYPRAWYWLVKFYYSPSYNQDTRWHNADWPPKKAEQPATPQEPITGYMWDGGD